MKNSEHFSDVDLSQFGYGGLSGAAAENHGKARAVPTAEGVKVSLTCDNCGAPNILTISWPEAVVISTGRLPPGWKILDGYIHPDVGCASCRRFVTPGMTPDEAQRWVKAGVHARFIDPQQVQALAQQAVQGAVR